MLYLGRLLLYGNMRVGCIHHYVWLCLYLRHDELVLVLFKLMWLYSRALQ